MKTLNPEVKVVSVYTKFDHVYVRESQGYYTNLRWFMVWLTQLVFFGLPWLNWNGRPAVLFDLPARKFYLFGYVLLPQDFIFLTLLLIICAYSLFLFTAVTGRIWCGFSCPQTVYTQIFMWLESKVEGKRGARMRLDRQAWTAEKVLRKGIKQVLWLGFALLTGFSFVAWFNPAPELLYALWHRQIGLWAGFWLVFYAAFTNLNAAIMRDHFCRYLCPYARFQGAMMDKDTLIVSYDKQRGEPRQAWTKQASASAQRGSCIDCSLCVQVCPTGIDIRQGLQHDCIGCAACIDACDSVMDKIKAPRGLIRFSTEHADQLGLSLQQLRLRMLRPRVLIYSAILAIIVVGFIWGLQQHSDLRLNVLRDRSINYRQLADDVYENVYRLNIISSAEKTRQIRVSVNGASGFAIVGQTEFELASTATRLVPVTVRLQTRDLSQPQQKILFKVYDVNPANGAQSLVLEESSQFYLPRSGSQR